MSDPSMNNIGKKNNNTLGLGGGKSPIKQA